MNGTAYLQVTISAYYHWKCLAGSSCVLIAPKLSNSDRLAYMSRERHAMGSIKT